MKIAMNVAWMAPGKAGGMEWYVRALIDELAEIDQQNNYLLITSHLNDESFETPGTRWEKYRYDGDEVSPASYRRLPGPQESQSPPYLDQKLRAWGAELLFCPLMYALPLVDGIPVVATIPDLQHKALSELFVDFELGSRNIGFPDTVRRATAVLGISEHVASEVRSTYAVDPERVVATPLGLSPDFVTDPDIIASYTESALARYRVSGRYLFFPGNAWPHKNHNALIEAFEDVVQKFPDVKLILTGEHAVGELIPPRLLSSIDHLGYVSREELIGLMAGAEALVFPSRFEGFGLPLLEAMAVSTPILCSDLPTLHEVGGDVPKYFDPDSVDSIATTISDFLSSDTELGRQRNLMPAQVARFSYRTTAEKTLEVFSEVASGKRTAPAPLTRPNVALDGRSELLDGLSRWSIDSPELLSVSARMVAVPHTPDGRPRLPSVVAVSVNGVVVGELRLEAGGPSRLLDVPVPAWIARQGIQEIELNDLSDPRARESSGIRLAHLAVIDGGDGEMRIV